MTPGSKSATTTAFTRGYLFVNGLNMYYEIRGAGRPLVLLHGGLTTIGASFGALLPSLARSRMVIAVEQQGHGHTADIDRPLTFEQMADDTAALLRQLEIKDADCIGYSDGGNVAIGLAIRHPELVRKVAVAGTNFNNNGLYPEIREAFKAMKAEDLGDEMRDLYAAVAPNPKAWPTVVQKVMQQALTFEGWKPDDIAAMHAPMLVMIGDADIVRPEHAVEMFRLLPQARLAILPGTDHMTLMARTDQVNSMVTEFFDAAGPEPD